MTINRFLSSKMRMTALFSGLILVFVFLPLFGGSVPAPFWFQEHFFNTLVIAENFVKTGLPTFDGTTPTNDFSPLWMLMLAGLSALVPASQTAFFILVRFLIGAALALALYLFDRLIKELDFTPAPAARFLVLSFLTALFMYTGLTGSDAALAIPAVFLNALCLLKALRFPSFKKGVICGLSVVLCALVRFDSAAFFLTACLVFYLQFNRKGPISTKQLLVLLPGLFVGLIPLMIWADLQQSTFGTAAPAGMISWAKTQDHAAWRMLLVLFVQPVRYFMQIPTALALLTFPVLLLGLVAHISFPWIKRDQTPRDCVFYTLIWYPILYLATIAAVTFISVPEYAFYPLAIGGPAALLFAVCKIDGQIGEKEKKQAQTVWFILGIMLCAIAIFTASRPRSEAYGKVAEAVSEFARENKGTYAMSAGAGMASYLSKAPFVRLDGMAQDKAMLDFIGTQSTMDKALAKYGVEYYVAINPVSGQKCYSAREPMQNHFGGSNKGMNDWLCAEPVFVKQATPKTKIAIFRIDEKGKAF